MNVPGPEYGEVQLATTAHHNSTAGRFVDVVINVGPGKPGLLASAHNMLSAAAQPVRDHYFSC